MSAEADGSHDALIAARLLAIDPIGLGGMRLRGPPGPGRDAVMATLGQLFPIRRMPVHIDDGRLTGEIDIAASLSAGRKIIRAGLLEESAGMLLAAAGVERMSDATAGRIAAAIDGGSGFALVLLDEGVDDERPPEVLTERVAFHVDIADAAPIETYAAQAARVLETVGAPSDEVLTALAATALALGVESARAHLFALRAARAAAVVAGRNHISAEDAALAARLVLASRATRLPASEPPDTPKREPDESSGNPEQVDRLDDIVLAAARAALPAALIGDHAGAAGRGGASRAGGAGERRRSMARGRPIGARAGLPRGGARLALIDTLRAAAPWQRLRGDTGEGRLHLRREDLRVRRFQDRAETLTIFAVDASGSAAAARLAEAKGAVELLLSRAYAERAEVALVAFRGEAAETLLPPTRSLTRARRLLAELPGGGGTPLAAGIEAARALGEAARQRGRTPSIVLLTDGRANVAADGGASRPRAAADADAAGKRLAAAGLAAALIDTGVRPQPEAARVATAMRARYLHLPRADAARVHAALAL